MIETQIIKLGKKPVAVILDYREYIKLKEIQEEYELNHDNSRSDRDQRKWHRYDNVKKKLGFK